MNPEIQTTIQIIAIVGAVATLLGWLVKTIVSYFIQKSNAKDKYLEDLVAQNQSNVENFVNTVNHNQAKFNQSIDQLSSNIKAQTDVFKEFIKNK